MDAVARAEGIGSRQFRDAMGRFATGVTVVTVEVDGEIFGMTANAFMAGSLTPPLCMVCIDHGARMHARLTAARRFGVSFLSEHQVDLAQHFAGRPVAGLHPHFHRLGDLPVLAASVGAVAADVVRTAACGDHTIFIGEVVGFTVEDRDPLLFFRGRYASLDHEQRLQKIAVESFW